jgi:hypothetical protein
MRYNRVNPPKNWMRRRSPRTRDRNRIIRFSDAASISTSAICKMISLFDRGRAKRRNNPTVVPRCAGPSIWRLSPVVNVESLRFARPFGRIVNDDDSG